MSSDEIENIPYDESEIVTEESTDELDLNNIVEESPEDSNSHFDSSDIASSVDVHEEHKSKVQELLRKESFVDYPSVTKFICTKCGDCWTEFFRGCQACFIDSFVASVCFQICNFLPNCICILVLLICCFSPFIFLVVNMGHFIYIVAQPGYVTYDFESNILEDLSISLGITAGIYVAICIPLFVIPCTCCGNCCVGWIPGLLDVFSRIGRLFLWCYWCWDEESETSFPEKKKRRYKCCFLFYWLWGHFLRSIRMLIMIIVLIILEGKLLIALIITFTLALPTSDSLDNAYDDQIGATVCDGECQGGIFSDSFMLPLARVCKVKYNVAKDSVFIICAVFLGLFISAFVMIELFIKGIIMGRTMGHKLKFIIIFGCYKESLFRRVTYIFFYLVIFFLTIGFGVVFFVLEVVSTSGTGLDKQSHIAAGLGMNDFLVFIIPYFIFCLFILNEIRVTIQFEGESSVDYIKFFYFQRYDDLPDIKGHILRFMLSDPLAILNNVQTTLSVLRSDRETKDLVQEVKKKKKSARFGHMTWAYIQGLSNRELAILRAFFVEDYEALRRDSLLNQMCFTPITSRKFFCSILRCCCCCPVIECIRDAQLKCIRGGFGYCCGTIRAYFSQRRKKKLLKKIIPRSTVKSSSKDDEEEEQLLDMIGDEFDINDDGKEKEKEEKEDKKEEKSEEIGEEEQSSEEINEETEETGEEENESEENKEQEILEEELEQEQEEEEEKEEKEEEKELSEEDVEEEKKEEEKEEEEEESEAESPLTPLGISDYAVYDDDDEEEEEEISSSSEPSSPVVLPGNNNNNSFRRRGRRRGMRRRRRGRGRRGRGGRDRRGRGGRRRGRGRGRGRGRRRSSRPDSSTETKFSEIKEEEEEITEQEEGGEEITNEEEQNESSNSSQSSNSSGEEEEEEQEIDPNIKQETEIENNTIISSSEIFSEEEQKSNQKTKETQNLTQSIKKEDNESLISTPVDTPEEEQEEKEEKEQELYYDELDEISIIPCGICCWLKTCLCCPKRTFCLFLSFCLLICFFMILSMKDYVGFFGIFIGSASKFVLSRLDNSKEFCEKDIQVHMNTDEQWSVLRRNESEVKPQGLPKEVWDNYLVQFDYAQQKYCEEYSVLSSSAEIGTASFRYSIVGILVLIVLFDSFVKLLLLGFFFCNRLKFVIVYNCLREFIIYRFFITFSLIFLFLCCISLIFTEELLTGGAEFAWTFWFTLFGVSTVFFLKLFQGIKYDGPSAVIYYWKLLISCGGCWFPDINASFTLVFEDPDELLQQTVTCLACIKNAKDMKKKKNNSKFAHYRWDLVENFGDSEIKRLKRFFFGKFTSRESKISKLCFSSPFKPKFWKAFICCCCCCCWVCCLDDYIRCFKKIKKWRDKGRKVIPLSEEKEENEYLEEEEEEKEEEEWIIEKNIVEEVKDEVQNVSDEEEKKKDEIVEEEYEEEEEDEKFGEDDV